MPGSRVRRPENGLKLLTRGYGWLPDRRRAAPGRTVGARLGGLPVTAIEGPDAARFLYDEDHVRRAHALPEPVQGTLFGKGAVHTLDGEAHRVRKSMFVGLLMRADGIDSLVRQVTSAWDHAVDGWIRRPEIVLFDEAAEVIAGAVTRWAGVPVTDDEVPGAYRLHDDHHDGPDSPLVTFDPDVYANGPEDLHLVTYGQDVLTDLLATAPSLKV